jgi:hypothetical protein
MIKKVKLYLSLIWLMLTQSDSIKELDIRQQLSVSSFQKAVDDLEKVQDAYAQRADLYFEESKTYRERAKQASKMSDIADAKSAQTGVKVAKLKKLID